MGEGCTEEQLVLYETGWCPFCLRVRAVVRRLGIEIPSRDVARQREYRAELVAARGRGTVPVLRVVSSGRDEWIGESVDIIRYLEDRYG
jgi:glutathione S-transferase